MSRSRGGVALVVVLLVSASLRPAVTSVGPLLPDIGASVGADALALGVLGAIPLLAFSMCSPFGAGLVRARGVEGALLVAMAVLTAGILVRSFGGVAGLWMGSAVAAGAIGIANVVTPVLVKRDFARAAVATAAFTAALSGSAALASGTAVPLARWLGGWREALAVWAVLSATCVVILARRARANALLRPDIKVVDPSIRRTVWRSPVAWRVTAFFGLQSMTYYTFVTWLPTIEQSFGIDSATAGWHLLLYQVLGAACGLAIGFVMDGRTDHRTAVVLVSLPVVIAAVGLIAYPGLALVWIMLASAGAGSALTVALTLVVVRAKNPEEAAALSGMAQSLGYLIAALGPLSAGAAARFLGWSHVLLVVAAVASVQVLISGWVGRDQTV